jgi:hypothetical protein
MMNDELKAAVVRYMNGIEDRLARVEDFASDQVPLLVTEWLRWEFWSSVMIALAILSAAAACFWFSCKCKEIYQNTTDEESKNCAAIFGTFSLFVTPVLMLLSLPFVYSAIKVAIAPRVVIVERVAGMVRGR